MGRHIKCTWGNDRDTGAEGFTPDMFRNWSNFLPSQRLGHDLIDHIGDETGSAQDELKALGVCAWHSEFFHRYANTYKTRFNELASALQQTFHDYYYEFLPRCEEKYSLDDEEIEELRNLLVGAWEELDGEVLSEEAESYDSFCDNISFDAVFSWLCLGYANGKKRYRKYDKYDVFAMKDLINEELRNFIKRNDCFEGFTATINYSFACFQVWVKDTTKYEY